MEVLRNTIGRRYERKAAGGMVRLPTLAVIDIYNDIVSFYRIIIPHFI